MTNHKEFESWCKTTGHDYCFDLNQSGKYQWADAQGAYEAFCYGLPQPAQKPLMLEKFREMEALLDDSNAPQHKTITDDELKIIMETTMPVIDWKARYGVELNNGERNKWMLEWFIAFAREIESARRIKE